MYFFFFADVPISFGLKDVKKCCSFKDKKVLIEIEMDIEVLMILVEHTIREIFGKI